jgi:hypothetical protein
MDEIPLNGHPLSASDLAEKISGYAKIRLCVLPDGIPNHCDWILHEHDRYLIVKALRLISERTLHDKETIPR